MNHSYNAMKDLLFCEHRTFDEVKSQCFSDTIKFTDDKASLCAVGALLSLAISSHTLIYASWYFCIGRLYANSLLASLNGRNTIRGQTEDIDHILLSIPNAVLSPSSNSGSNGQRPDISIRIDTSTHKDVEADDSKQDDDSFVNTLANPSKSSL
ncbi:uncharacterized protein ARMOST_10262 [Armillaria ostoyae]|uniref:DUF6534 domain-containing protein n=1 Tax=Armillaria ostoyae TaxID=47428 RepID=A0A284RDT9_ARMOS|nr:uncharacterized protein ARMOST_10262 [Armillaria ostoyae]